MAGLTDPDDGAACSSERPAAAAGYDACRHAPAVGRRRPGDLVRGRQREQSCPARAVAPRSVPRFEALKATWVH
jgi:hypothetical protein